MGEVKLSPSESSLHALRNSVTESIYETGYNIKIPIGDWTQITYPVGPIEGRLSIYEGSLRFEFFLGKYSNNVTGSVLATKMARAIPAPGPNVRSSLSPQPILELSVDVQLGFDNAFMIPQVAIAQTADLAINLLKIGITTGNLLDPTPTVLSEFGLLKPSLLGQRGHQSRNWKNAFAGSELLLARSDQSVSSGKGVGKENYYIHAEQNAEAKRLKKECTGVRVTLPDGLHVDFIPAYVHNPEDEPFHFHEYSFEINDTGDLSIYIQDFTQDDFLGYDVLESRVVATFPGKAFKNVEFSRYPLRSL